MERHIFQSGEEVGEKGTMLKDSYEEVGILTEMDAKKKKNTWKLLCQLSDKDHLMVKIIVEFT